MKKEIFRLVFLLAVQSLMKGCTVYLLPEQIVEHYLRLENITVTVATHRQISDESCMDSLMWKELLKSFTSKLYCLCIRIGYCKWSLSKLHLTSINHIVLSVDNQIYLHSIAYAIFSTRDIGRLYRRHSGNLQCLLNLTNMTETQFLKRYTSPS